MTELVTLVTKEEEAKASPFRTARVIKVDGRTLTVDFNSGTAGTTIQATASCNPRPDQNVIVAMDGNRPVAIGVVDGPYRQSSIVATANSTYHVTGLINGVSTLATKIGSFTASIGNRYPLMWSANADSVWALPDPGTGFTPPPPDPDTGGGGTGGGPGTPGTYTTTYAASSSGIVLAGGGAQSGDLNLSIFSDYGYFVYGYGRFNELAGKTIHSGRINLQRTSGSGNVTLSVSGVAGSSSTGTGGWATLSNNRIAALIARPSFVSAQVNIYGSGALRGVPAGAIQITWS